MGDVPLTAAAWTIPFFELQLGAEEKAAVLDVLESNWLTTGPRGCAFEEEFASHLGAGIQAVSVSSGTAALHLACAALGLGEGDEVICPSLTFVATANAVRYVGARPVFADICSVDEWNICPGDVERKITERTRAIVVVHYGGYPCRMEELGELAHRRGLKLIEDASHAPRVRWQGRSLGTWGDIGCFSFFSNKNMTTGEGGMLVTGDEGIGRLARSLRSHGMTATTYERFQGHAFAYDVEGLGFNYRMDEMRAALGKAQVDRLPWANQRRRELVEIYRRLLRQQLPEIGVPFADFRGESGYHIFPVLLPEGLDDRNRVMAQLAHRGIQTSIHYRPVHTFSAYEEFRRTLLPVTEAIAPRILSLPLYPTLDPQQIHAVVTQLRDCLGALSCR